MLVTLILRGRGVVMPRGTTLLMPGDHVFVAMRISLEPLINRLFDPDPEPPELPAELQLSFNAATTVEQLYGFYGLPLLPELAGSTAAQSLAALLAQSTPGDSLQLGALRIRPGSDPEHVSVSCVADAA